MKKVFIGCGALVALVVIAAVALTVWSKKPTEMLMNKAVADAEKRIRRDVSVGKFGGNPFTGFYITDIGIASKKKGMPDTLRMDTLKFSISLPMLLKRKIVFSRISLVRPAVYIERYADGGNTMNDIMETLKPKEEEKDKEKKRPSILFERIDLKGMIVKLKLYREEGEPVELLLEPIDITLVPKEAGVYENFTVTVSAAMDGLKVDATGALAMSPAPALEMKWKTNSVDTAELPAFMESFKSAAEKIGLSARAEVSGSVTVSEKSTALNAEILLEDAKAFSQEFGSGRITARFGDSMLNFEGGVGKEGPSLDAKGHLRTGEDPMFDTLISLKKISVSPALMMFLGKDAPEIITGAMGGDVRLEGPGLDMKKLNAGGNVTIRNGQINYPTPIPHGTGTGWAPVPYDKIDVEFMHRQPNVTLRSVRLVGKSITATGNGTISYTLNEKPGGPTGPTFFNISAKADSPAVEEILALNPFMGRALSGKLSVDGRFQGNTKDKNSLKGNATFALLDGKIVNPYEKQASKLPLNSNLSHYEFDSLKGTVNVADSVAGTNSIALRSALMNADMRGTLDFDGAIKAHADTLVKPSVLATIADFNAVLPAIQDKLEKIDRVDASFELGGTLQAPQVHWNADEFGKMIGKRLMEKKGEELLDKALDKFDKKIGGDGDGDVTDTMKKKLKDKLKKIF